MMGDLSRVATVFSMVRFGTRAGSGDEPEESSSFRDLARSGDATRFATDLSQVETDVEDFGDSAAEGFASSWSATAAPEVDGLAETEEQTRVEKRAARLRNLDRRLSPGGVVVALVVVGLVVAGFFVFDRLSDAAPGTSADGDPLEEAFLVAPGQPRAYAEAGGPLQIDSGWALVDTFVADGPDSDPTPVPADATGLPAGVVAAPLVWGERAHVAIIGPGVGADDICAVTSLFSAELDVIDVAADGACDGRFAATGDRLACRSENMVLLEVWPTNPGIIGEQPDAVRVRVRLERQGAGEMTESLRTTVDLDARLQIGLRELSGAPESQGQIVIGDVRESCALLDRSDVTVQLL